MTSRAWIYEHHKDWLVHNAKGDPVPLGDVWDQKTDVLYALDTTHPGAQEYLRETYKTLTREWGSGSSNSTSWIPPRSRVTVTAPTPQPSKPNALASR